MTNAELAILTLIAEQPRHGYEIEQVITERGMRDWTEIGFSSIYYILKKLEKDGLIESRTEMVAGRGPARQVYHLTEAGAAACQQALLEALSTPRQPASSLLLGLGNLPGVPAAQAIAALKEHRDTLTQQLAQVQARVEEQRPLPDFVEAMFDYSLAMIEAERAWIADYVKRLEEQTMLTVDFKKEFKQLYNPSAKEFALVEVPPLQFLMIDGQGDPNTAPAYQEAIEALYGVAYTLKFMSKNELGKDYVVPPLEGLWWAEDMAAFATQLKDTWQWTAMIMQPDWLTPEMVTTAIKQVEKKKGPLPGLSKLRLETYHEGLSVQIMHIGPFSTEGPTLAKLHQEFIPANGLAENGKHHEIYLGDPRKTAPDKLKTVLRQPVKRI